MELLYYSDGRGREPAALYLEGLERAGELSALATFGRVAELLSKHGVAIGMPYVRLIDRRARIYELRFGDHRVAFIVVDGDVVLLNGWRKRSQRLDASEAATAARLAGEWRERSS